MKVGDVIKVNVCTTLSGKRPIKKCGCFLCSQDSNRIGLVVSESVVAKVIDAPFWEVLFDVGLWNMYQSDVDAGDVEVISEGR